MRIKFIAESDEERKILGDEPEHKGVIDVFIFGKEKDKDGDITDFHFWKGSYQFLLGNLSYFSGKITDEQRMKTGMKKLIKEDINNSVEPQTKPEDKPNMIQFPHQEIGTIGMETEIKMEHIPADLPIEPFIENNDNKNEETKENKETENEDTNNKV